MIDGRLPGGELGERAGAVCEPAAMSAMEVVDIFAERDSAP